MSCRLLFSIKVSWIRIDTALHHYSLDSNTVKHSLYAELDYDLGIVGILPRARDFRGPKEIQVKRNSI